MAPSTRRWWRRATSALKDKQSVYLSRVAGGGQRARPPSHDERSVDYKNAGRVFAWARTSPTCLDPLMRALTRRATRTRSWVVGLKTLLLVHGVLLCSDAALRIGRLPFDLSDFRDHSARPSVASYGFSAFVRAYFQFLDYRSVFSSPISQFYKRENSPSSFSDSMLLAPVPSHSLSNDLEMLVKMQHLLELLMQIRPYADGMEVGLILEAMNCVVIEIFDVYSSICRGIARFLVDVLGSNSSTSSASLTDAASSKAKNVLPPEERRRLGMAGMRVLRRAAKQNEQLSSFFGLCRSLGVLNAAEIPPVESIPEEDIRDLEDLVRGGVPGSAEDENYRKEDEDIRSKKPYDRRSVTVVTEEWEVFEEDAAAAATPLLNGIGNPFLSLKDEVKPAFLRLPWAAPIHHQAAPPFAGGNLIELISRKKN
ncbi:putative clathrin assembly protein At1g25240 [Phalaenopsis equestris]|uniref:putative clathrin assembly protein At1g25240 n=1 Tax=Phalaenopsis equestris TaxID=78828 RepID=UPI0009E3DA4D|nr:putative clathrin assembly protein At1g25240 [Phalaenopsis equestris]